MYDHIAHYYDLTHDALTEDVAFVVGQATEQTGPVLEMGCGSGRLLIPLARAGQTVVGLDNSLVMLERAKAWLTREPDEVARRVVLVAGDVTLPSTAADRAPFGLIVFGYNTWLHLDAQQAAAALRQVRGMLAPSGRLLIDVENPFTLAEAGDDPLLTLENVLDDRERNELVVQMTAWRSAPTGQAVDVTWLYDASPVEGGPVRRTVARMRYHYLYPHEITLLLAQAGLRQLALYGGYDRRPFDEMSERLLVLAEAQDPQ